MKVLHILNELKFSGAEIMYTAAASEFRNLGCQLYVVNTSKKMGDYATHFIDAGYTVVHIPYIKSFKGKLTFYKRLYNYIKKEHIDIVHVHRDGIKCVISYCAWKNGAKCICTYHTNYIRAQSCCNNILFHFYKQFRLLIVEHF